VAKTKLQVYTETGRIGTKERRLAARLDRGEFKVVESGPCGRSPNEPPSGCGLLEFVQRVGGVIHIHKIPDRGVIDDSKQGAVARR
jgi:hypothetical protein